MKTIDKDYSDIDLDNDDLILDGEFDDYPADYEKMRDIGKSEKGGEKNADSDSTKRRK